MTLGEIGWGGCNLD